MSNYKCNFNYNKNYNKPSISYNKQHKGNIICNNCYYNNCLKHNDDNSKKIDCMKPVLPELYIIYEKNSNYCIPYSK